MAAVAERRFLHTFTRGSHEGRDREEAAPPMLTTSRETELTGATVVVADVDVAATAVAETANKQSQEQRRAPSFLTVTTTTISFLPVAADRCFE